MRKYWLLWAWLTICLLLTIAAYTVAADQAPVEGPEDVWPYVAVFTLVLGDAVIAVLPGETTLNTASTVVVAIVFLVVARGVRRERRSGSVDQDARLGEDAAPH